jgi:hypothetical protein
MLPQQSEVRTIVSVHPEPRLTAWTCFRCGIQFDERVDHIDHMFMLHGVDLLDHIPDKELMAMLEED